MPKLSAVLNDAAYQSADDSLKTFYVQNTETKDWWLDVDEPAKLDVAGAQSLQNKKDELKRVHGEKTAAERELVAYRALGAVEELKEKLEANRPEEVTKLVERYEAEKAQLKQSYEAPLTEAQERAAKLAQQVERSLQRSEISALITKYDLDPELSPAVLANYIKPVQVDGDNYATKVFDDAGQPALVAGQEMSADQLIKSWQEAGKNKGLFTVKPADNPNGSRSTNLGANKNLEGLHGVEKLKAARGHSS